MSEAKASGKSPSARSVRPLGVDTWPAFARLVEANNGVWGGCWCMGFHLTVGKGRTAAQNRAEKKQRVTEGRTHAALVLDGDQCLGWCQFGSPEELPEIKSRRRYEKDLAVLPDWRITCFFTGKGLRGRGVADAALGGALAEIAHHGGGVVEGYPEETDDRTLSGLVPAHRADGRLREPRLHPHPADLPAPLGCHPHRRPGLTTAASGKATERTRPAGRVRHQPSAGHRTTSLRPTYGDRSRCRPSVS